MFAFVFCSFVFLALSAENGCSSKAAEDGCFLKVAEYFGILYFRKAGCGNILGIIFSILGIIFFSMVSIGGGDVSGWGGLSLQRR